MEGRKAQLLEMEGMVRERLDSLDQVMVHRQNLRYRQQNDGGPRSVCPKGKLYLHAKFELPSFKTRTVGKGQTHTQSQTSHSFFYLACL